MASEDERMQILEMIESGKISAAEGLQLLQSLVAEDQASLPPSPDQLEDEHRLSGVSQETYTAPDEARSKNDPQTLDGEPMTGEVYLHPSESDRPELPPDVDKWRRWWIIPLWTGVGVTMIGSILMYAALQSSGMGFWFVFASLFFALGLVLIILAWQSRTARWLHLRIRQRPGHTPERIALSFPLPIRLTAWFFRTFRDRIPGIQNTSIDEVILALDHSATPENPLYISVNDEEDGENVQIFIG